MSSKPLLSLCIPTYNRADLLRKALSVIVPQVSALGGLVEVVVSDNCSSDRTPEVVKEFILSGSVRYNRNAENIGGGRNFLLLAQSLAQGEFCWIIGDDDLVYEGAVSAVANALLSYPQADYVFVNSTFQTNTHQEDKISNLPHSGRRGETILVEKGEHIIEFGADGLDFSAVKNPLLRLYKTLWREAFYSPLFSYLGSHVIRTRLWREQKFEFTTDAEFPSMEATFPHSCTAIRAMVGKPAVYIGQPQIAVYIGAQDWTKYWPLIQTVRVLELADFLETQGAEAAMVKLYRSTVLKNSSGLFWKLLSDKNTPGREHFSASRICRQNWNCPGLYAMLLRHPAQQYLRNPLRQLRDAVTRSAARPTRT